MKSLTKAQIKERGELIERFKAEYVKVETAIEKYNEALGAARSDMEDAITDWNQVVADANQWRTEIAEAMEEFIDKKSDKWRDEKGSPYEDFKSAFADEEFEEIDWEQPEDLDIATLITEACEDKMTDFPEEVNE